MKDQRKQDDWTDPVGVGEDEVVEWIARIMLCVGLAGVLAVIFKFLGWG